MSHESSTGLGQDTAPLAVAMSPAAADRAAADMSTTLLIRAIVAAVATVALTVAAVLLFRHGVRADDFPPFLSGTTRTVITRYSAPWIGAAAAAELAAVLALTTLGVDLYRRSRLRRLGDGR